MFIQIIKKLQEFLKTLVKALNSDRLTRFLITSLLTLLFTINFSGISLWFPSLVRSEGSFQFGASPTTTLNQQGLIEYDSPYNDAGGTTTGIGQLKRPIFVDIQNANEIINISACGNAFTDDWKADIYYVGAQPPTDSNSYNGTYAAYPPASGTLLSTGATNLNGSIGTNGTNPNCDNYSLLATGAGNTTYPISVAATSGPGVYEIRLQNLTENTNSSPPLTLFRQFDIAVTNTISPTVKIPAAPNPQISQGRVWSYVWAFNGGGFDVVNSTNQNYYIVVPGGSPGTNFVWQLNLNQFAGFVYELVANNRGVDSPNAAALNVRGLSVPVAGNSVTPQYRMYLDYPDQTFTKPVVGPTISNLRFENSGGINNIITPSSTFGVQDTGFFKFTSSLPGTYEIIIDTNKDGVFGDASGLDVQLRGDTDAFGNVSALWDGKNNLGATLPVGSYNAQVRAIVGEYHFIAGDVETSGPASGLTINEATSPFTTATTPVYWDDKTGLTTGYQAGTGTTSLAGATSGARHTWGTTSSGGGQGANGSSWGDVRYLDTFVYGSFTVGTTTAIIADIDDNDYGDAPDTYGTNRANSGGEGIGASHVLSTSIKLGTAVTDFEADGQPSPAATLDNTTGTNDEEGVTAFSALNTTDTTYSVTLRVQNTPGVAAPAYLGGWIDFNRNGRFEATEGVVQTIPNGTNGNVVINWTGLGGLGLTAGNTFARFRINNDPLTTSDFIGTKRNGEVEDYQITITGTGVPGINLVKRITAINNIQITGFVDGANTATSNDNDPNWPTANTQYLRGAIDCTTASPCNGGTISSVAPSGSVEYTIYFLSNGATAARNVQLCDRIPANTIFQPDIYGVGRGILLGWNTTGGALPLPDPTTSIGAGKVALSNLPDADAGQFLATNVSVTNSPPPCNNGSTNPDGALLVRLGAAIDVPKATASGTPTNSYGFIRFQVRVK